MMTGLAVGFGHCIGMCGPLTISFALSRKSDVFISLLLYHCGRVATYSLLGAAMAAVGSFTRIVAHIAILQKSAMFLAGGLIVVMGLAMGGWVPYAPWFDSRCSPSTGFAQLSKRLTRSASKWAYLPLGLVLGLLPCGPVYTALLGVVRGGMEAPGMHQGVALGMLQMFLFGLGTIPALLLVAVLADMGWLKFRDRIYKAAALLMIGLGIYYLISAARY